MLSSRRFIYPKRYVYSQFSESIILLLLTPSHITFSLNQLSHVLVVSLFALFIALSVSRTAAVVAGLLSFLIAYNLRLSIISPPNHLCLALHNLMPHILFEGYSAPFDVYKHIPQTFHNTSVCVGKEWYRFPSSFFLPRG